MSNQANTNLPESALDDAVKADYGTGRAIYISRLPLTCPHCRTVITAISHTVSVAEWLQHTHIGIPIATTREQLLTRRTTTYGHLGCMILWHTTLDEGMLRRGTIVCVHDDNDPTINELWAVRPIVAASMLPSAPRLTEND